MKTELVEPRETSPGDANLLRSAPINDARAPQQFETHKIRRIEEPNDDHRDSYVFEYDVPGDTADVFWPRTVNVERVVLEQALPFVFKQ